MCLKLTKLQDGSAEGGRMQITSRNVKQMEDHQKHLQYYVTSNWYYIMLLRFNYYFMLFWYQSPSPAKTTE